MSDLEACRSLWRAGLEAIPLSIYCVRPYPRGGLLLGFTATAPDQIDANVRKLSDRLRSLSTASL